MDDGIYIELFAVKNGVRYNAKIIDMKDVSKILTNGLVDGIEKLCENTNEDVNVHTEKQCSHNWKIDSINYDNKNMYYTKKYICTKCGKTMTEEVGAFSAD